jgi:hypothetical protein
MQIPASTPLPDPPSWIEICCSPVAFGFSDAVPADLPSRMRSISDSTTYPVPDLPCPIAFSSKEFHMYSPLYVNDPGDLIATIPSMLGFRPERSLVVAILQDSTTTPDMPARIVAVTRFDRVRRRPHPTNSARLGTGLSAKRQHSRTRDHRRRPHRSTAIGAGPRAPDATTQSHQHAQTPLRRW